jgi:hypothetical protein
MRDQGWFRLLLFTRGQENKMGIAGTQRGIGLTGQIQKILTIFHFFQRAGREILLEVQGFRSQVCTILLTLQLEYILETGDTGFESRGQFKKVLFRKQAQESHWFYGPKSTHCLLRLQAHINRG